MKGDHQNVNRNAIRHAYDKCRFDLRATYLQKEIDEGCEAAAAAILNTVCRPHGSTLLSKC